jgi:hypothetical protein
VTPVNVHPVIVALAVPSYARLATVKSTVTGSAARTPAGGSVPTSSKVTPATDASLRARPRIDDSLV